MEIAILGDDFCRSSPRRAHEACLRLADGTTYRGVGSGPATPILQEYLSHLALAVVLAASLPNIVDDVLAFRKRLGSKTDLFLGLGPLVLAFREEVYLMYGASLWPSAPPAHMLELQEGHAPDPDADRRVQIAERRAARHEQIRSASRQPSPGRHRSKSRNRVGWEERDQVIIVSDEDTGGAAPSTGPAAAARPEARRPASRDRRDDRRDDDRPAQRGGRSPSRPRSKDRDRSPSRRRESCASRGLPLFNRVWHVPDGQYREVCRLWNTAKGDSKCPRTPCQHLDHYGKPRLHLCLFCLSDRHRRTECPCERGDAERPRKPSTTEQYDWQNDPRARNVRH